MFVSKKLTISSLAFALIGCSLSADSNNTNTESSTTKPTGNIGQKKWHFFHRSRNYRFRLQSFEEDVSWNRQMLKLLRSHGYTQSMAKFNNPRQLLELFMRTNLKDAKLVRQVGISSVRKYQIPVIFYEISTESPYGVGSYTWARMINYENLVKISDCLNPAPRFKEGWTPTFQKGSPILGGQCFRLRE